MKILIYKIIKFLSSRYRAGIGACVLDFIKANTKKEDCEGKALNKKMREFYQSYRPTLRWYHTIWFMAEICFLLPTMGSVTTQFKDLVGLADYPADEIDEIENDVEGKRDTLEIWKIAYRFVIQGQLSDALKMIEYAVYEEGNEEAIEFLEDLNLIFKSFPTVPLTKTVQGAFVKERRNWLNKVEYAINKFDSSSSGILDVLKILRGDEQLINLHSKHWYEIIVANMLFINTSIYLSDLPSCAESAWEIKPPKEDLEYHKMLYLVITEKLSDFINISLNKNPAKNNLSLPFVESWILAHLCDLLHHSARIEDDDDIQFISTSERDNLLILYANDLVTSQNLWQFSLHYASHVSKSHKPSPTELMKKV